MPSNIPWFRKWANWFGKDDTPEVEEELSEEKLGDKWKMSTSKKILLRRWGAHGDVLCLTSTIPGLLRKYPDAVIDFQAAPGMTALVMNHPDINRVIEGNVLSDAEYKQYDMILEPDHGTQWNDAICRVQCRMLNVPFSPPSLYLDCTELVEAPIFDIAVAHWTAKERRYERMQEVISTLNSMGRKIVQIDNGENLGVYQPKLGMRESAALAYNARVLLTVDTAFLHVGVAVEHPKMIVVFGSMTGLHNQFVPNATIFNYTVSATDLAHAVNLTLDDRPLPSGTIVSDYDGKAVTL